ncbi:MAG: hypothetical protein KJ760_19940 [Proteobacteria bacterium]|nr:hypothetical protein [Pseudomonadota bacterium]
MQVSNLEKQIIDILEQKYGHSIDKDDPLMLTITAQTLITEHLLELHKKNMEAEFSSFKEDLSVLLKSSKIDSTESKKIIEDHVKKAFLGLFDNYKTQLDTEFIKAHQEYKNAQKWYRKMKFWAIATIIITVLIFTVFFLKT